MRVDCTSLLTMLLDEVEPVCCYVNAYSAHFMEALTVTGFVHISIFAQIHSMDFANVLLY